MITCPYCEWETPKTETVSLVMEKKTCCKICADDIINSVPEEIEHGFY